MKSIDRRIGAQSRRGEIVTFVLLLLVALPIFIWMFIGKASSPPPRRVAPKMDPVLLTSVERRVVKEEEKPAPTPKPMWVDEPPASTTAITFKIVEVGPYATNQECIDALHARLQELTQEYMNQKLGFEIKPNGRPTGQELAMIAVDEEWTETLDTSVGPMLRRYSLVRLDKEYRQVVDALWHDTVVGKRLGRTGLAAGTVLLAVGVAYSFLKRTDGAYAPVEKVHAR